MSSVGEIDPRAGLYLQNHDSEYCAIWVVDVNGDGVNIVTTPEGLRASAASMLNKADEMEGKVKLAFQPDCVQCKHCQSNVGPEVEQ